MKKNKVLAFALAAAMAFTSVPMNSVHAEEGMVESETAVDEETQNEPEGSGGGETQNEPEGSGGGEVLNEPESPDGGEMQNEPEVSSGEEVQNKPENSGDGEAEPQAEGGETGDAGDTGAATATSPYILSYQGEAEIPAEGPAGKIFSNGRIEVVQDVPGKVGKNALRWNTTGTSGINLTNAIEEGTAVVEFELMPQSKEHETVTFYNRMNSGDTKQPMFTIAAYEETDGYELWLTDKREASTSKKAQNETKILKLVDEIIPKNTWIKGRAVFYLNESTTEKMRWDVQMAYYSAKEEYSTDDSKWIYGSKVTQDELEYSNGTVSATFEYKELKNIDYWITNNSASNKRALGDFAIYNVTGVSLKTAPGEQIQGETFDPGEAEVVVTYSTGYSGNVKLADLVLNRDYTVNGFDETTEAGECDITIRYMGFDVEANVSVGASQEGTLSAVKVKTPPAKTDYLIGETELDLEGLVLTESYNDENSKDLTDIEAILEAYVITDLDAATAGKVTITLTNKKNKEIFTTFDINVVDAKITDIKIKANPIKMKYYIGESFDAAGMVVEATYEGGILKTLTADDYEVSTMEFTSVGEKTITVTSKAKKADGSFATAELKVTVEELVFAPVEFAFDFNIEDANSKTAEGWVGIFVNKSKGTKYSLADYGYSKDKGYGLNTAEKALQGRCEAGKVIAGGDYVSISADVYSDYVLFKNAKGSFDVDLPNGIYNVQVVVGTVEKNTTTIQIEGNAAYTGTAAFTEKVSTGAVFQVIEIPGVEIKDGQMNILPTADSIARTNGIIISNINAPEAVKGTYSTADQKVSLTWNESMGCVSYNVYRTLDGVTEMIGTVEGTSYNDTKAEVMKTYTYFVRGVSAKGFETVKSNQVEVKIVDSSVPAPLTPTNAVFSDRAPDTVTLSWDLMENAVKYEIYAKSGEGASGLEGYELIGESTTGTYVYTGKDHLDKDFKVRAVGMGGNSAPTESVTSAEALPQAPANFQIKDMTAEATTLKWDAAENAKYYEIYAIEKDKEEGQTDLTGFTLVGNATDTEYSVKLTDHMDRYYKVRAVGLKGCGGVTEVAKSNAGVPGVPQNVKAVPEEEFTTITWDTVENASYYEIYWSDRDRTSLKGTKYETNGIEDYELLGTSNSTTFVLNLPTHIARYFKVVAVGMGGKSEPSEPAKADIVKKFNTQAEYLDRGLIAIKVEGGVYLGWRLTGDEYAKNATYHLYRDGVGIRKFEATDNTSFLDTEGTLASKYAVSVVIDGKESETCEEVSVLENPYWEVKLDQPEAYYDDKLTKKEIMATYTADTTDARVDLSTGEYVYTPNDTYIGDVDGDGEYELIVKWDGMSRDNSQGGYTSPVIIDCYKLDGRKLWRIDLGINIRAGAHYTQPVVADFDGDGKAEVMIRTADGSKDSAGTIIGEAGKDYRNDGTGNTRGQILKGPDYLTLFDGETGVALDTIEYIPQRGDVNDWGDKYGNRSDRFLSGAAYLDGEHISAVFARGYYTRAVVAAFTVENKKIVNQWVCDSKEEGNKSLYGQGAHSFTVADVDGDGCQEILYGSATIDNDGKLLYSLSDHPVTLGSKYIQGGHGDAERVTDMNLKNPGLEAFMVHEEHPNEANAEMHDAATGEYLFALPGDEDIGRGASGDIDPNHEGGEFWFNGANGALYASDGTKIAKRPSAVNHMVWFDGTMGRNFLDGSYDKTARISSGYIARWDYDNQKQVDILRVEDVEVNNTTKSNPCFQADIFGDWREEVAWRTDDNKAIRIYTSTETQEFRLYSLMHDPTYRAQMACNGSAYNQSPDAGFYIGYDVPLIQVPVPTLNIVKAGETPTPSPEPSETPAPSESPEPSEMPAPSESPKPSETPAPSESPKPSESPAPSGTPAPIASTEPKEFDESVMTPELKDAIKKATGGAETAAALTEHMKQDIINQAQSSGQEMVAENIVVQEIVVTVSQDGGKTWKPVTAETFPKEGILLTLPYPDGTNKNDFNFVVTHLITISCNGLEAGTIKNEPFELTDEGLELTIYSASPFAIGWSAKNSDIPSEDDDDEDDGPEETADEQTDSNKSSNPAKTGDHMGRFMWMWAVILVVAAAGIVSTLVVKVRRKK